VPIGQRKGRGKNWKQGVEKRWPSEKSEKAKAKEHDVVKTVPEPGMNAMIQRPKMQEKRHHPRHHC